MIFFWIGWLRMSHFFAFQCNVALSRMWIDGAIKIICLKSAKLLSFAVNSDHSSGTDPNLEALVQHRGCKVHLIYRRRPSVSLCQFERCNVFFIGPFFLLMQRGVRRSECYEKFEPIILLFWKQNQQFLLTFCHKVFSIDNRTTIIHRAGRKGRFAEI